MSFQKILVGVDGSVGSVAAVHEALELCVLPGARLTVLQVIREEGPLPTVSFKMPEGVDRMSFLADQSFVSVASVLGATSALWTRRIEQGYAPDEMCRVANEESTDLIVLGSRGLSPIGRALLGSVADKVVRHAHCSVLVVRAKDAPT